MHRCCYLLRAAAAAAAGGSRQLHLQLKPVAVSVIAAVTDCMTCWHTCPYDISIRMQYAHCRCQHRVKAAGGDTHQHHHAQA
jgi:hypothetical protein